MGCDKRIFCPRIKFVLMSLSMLMKLESKAKQKMIFTTSFSRLIMNMDAWIQFLFGSPRRSLVSLSVFGVISLGIIGMVAPQVIYTASNRLIEAFAPLVTLVVQALLTAFFVLVGLRIIWNAVSKKGGGGKK
jgi:uncharacterized membrane protein YcaP (DUF421 family)